MTFLARSYDSERVRLARKIAVEYGVQILTVRAQKYWTIGDYIEEGKYSGFLVLGIMDGKAVVVR
jgi:predicted type IV restriction endonuclease